MTTGPITDDELEQICWRSDHIVDERRPDLLRLLSELRQARAEREALRRVIDEVADYLLDKPATSGEVYAGNTLRQAARRGAPEPDTAAKETP